MKRQQKMGVLSALVILTMSSFGVSQMAQAADYAAGSTITVDTDAASGEQAFVIGIGSEAKADNATAIGVNNSATGVYSSAVGGSNTASGKYDVALGFYNEAKGTIESGSYNLAIGGENIASGEGMASAIGYSNEAKGDTSSAFGYDNTASGSLSSAVGASNEAEGTGSSAVGYDNAAKGDKSAAVGTYNEANEKGSNALGYWNVADGQYSTAIGARNETKGSGSTGVGYKNFVYGAKSASFGFFNKVGVDGDESGANTYVFGAYNEVTANNALVIGTSVKGMVGDGAIILGKNITGNVAANSVVIGDGSTSEAENTVSVGTTDGERKIVHVADGTETTDAATYGQIAKNETYTVSHGSVTIKTNANGDAFTISGLAATDADIGDTKKLVDAGLGDSVVDSVLNVNDKVGDTKKLAAAGLGDNVADSVLSVNDRVDTLNDRVDTLNDRVDTLSTDINKVGAGAAALAALHPEGFDPSDKWSFAVGYGHYKNANAGALGAFYKPNFDTTLSVGGTIGNGNSMLNAGVSFKLGQRGAKLSQNASNQQLVQEMQSLRMNNDRLLAQNEEQQKEISAQAQEIRDLKAQMARVLAKLGE